MSVLPKLPRVAAYIADNVYAAAEARRNQDRKSAKRRLRMSSIGKCQRLLWAELHDVPDERPPDGRVLTLFEHGNVIEDHVVRELRRAGYIVQAVDEKTGRQFRLSELDEQLVGHTDGKISGGIHTLGDDQEPLLLEIKSASDTRKVIEKDGKPHKVMPSQFDQCRSEGYEAWKPEYAAQLHSYMGAQGLSEALAVVYCKDTSEIYAERIRFDPDAYQALLRKAERVLAADTVIDRPGVGKSQFCAYCKWCSRNQWCWNATTGVQFDD